MVVAVPRVIDGLGHLKPAEEKDELEDEESSNKDDYDHDGYSSPDIDYESLPYYD